MARLSSAKFDPIAGVWYLHHSPLPHLDLTRFVDLDSSFYPVLLESPVEGPLAQWDILMAGPTEQATCLRGESCETLTALLSSIPAHSVHDLQSSPLRHLPFVGGWFFYFSYDYAQLIEPVIEAPGRSGDLLAQMTAFGGGVCRCRQTGEVWCFASDEAQFTRLCEDLLTAQCPDSPQSPQSVHLQEADATLFVDAVGRAQNYILAGDLFQANLSRPWSSATSHDFNPIQVYRQLRLANPAPFAALVRLDERHWIMSSSPERLFSVEGAWINTRPIAGTRKRGQDPAQDAALMAELVAHPKERAEHIMLIDLERNDLGRVCVPGSVEVSELMVVESYAHVHHIVSNVRGRLAADLSLRDVMHALFPGGTITGCPKVRCMQVIAELEQTPRGAYTGSVGYVSRLGSIDSNILIRSFEWQDERLVFRTGAGIVHDSMAAQELEETRHKAKGLLRAVDHV
jgi:anthranilate synthase component 1